MTDTLTAAPAAQLTEVTRQQVPLSALNGASQVRLRLIRRAGDGWAEVQSLTVPLDAQTRLDLIFLKEEAPAVTPLPASPSREPAAAADAGDTRYVQAPAGLHLRAGPSTDDLILETLQFSTPVQVLETVADGPWVRVRAGNRSGFVSEDWLTDSDPVPADAAPTDFAFAAWPTEHRRLTQGFAENPESYKKFNLPGHEGVDLVAPLGSPYFCVAPGKVIRVGNRRSDGKESAYGWHVIVDHGNGYSTLYAHAQPNPPVAVGQQLRAGDVVAISGNTGNSSGPHLHLTLKKSGFTLPDWPPGYMDPWPLLRNLL